ncbi:hypothetical protein ACFX5D_14165 [Flavobacterium sp. LB3P45]|uniref:Uncharacterized protein n=1 Tax=Flavobacterium fructosi TaxID=3230416 RepID=A0ABW6HR64_9FLAO
MSITITIIPLTDNESYNVNGHTVNKNPKGHYDSKTDLSEKEWRAFKKYENLVIDNPAFVRHTKATYQSK